MQEYPCIIINKKETRRRAVVIYETEIIYGATQQLSPARGRERVINTAKYSVITMTNSYNEMRCIKFIVFILLPK